MNVSTTPLGVTVMESTPNDVCTVATGWGLPLLIPSTVTPASSAVPFATPLRPERLTVRLVLVAPVTVPVTPLLLKLTESLAVLVSKPEPAIVMLVSVASKPALLVVTTGTTVATWRWRRRSRQS